MIRDLEDSIGHRLPNIQRVLDTKGRKAKIDMVLYSSDAEPRVVKGLTSSNLPAHDTDKTDATLFIVEAVDAEFIRYLHQRCLDTGRPFQPRFFEDFLDTSPWYGYDELTPQLPSLHSLERYLSHAHFRFIGCREFDEHLVLKEGKIFPYMEDTHDARNCAGSLNFTHKVSGDGTIITYNPVALTRNHLTVWFDAAEGRPWKTGVVLVESPFVAKGLPRLRPPCLHMLLDRESVSAAPVIQAHREALTICLQKRPTGPMGSIPSPYTILRDAFRIMALEWIIASTYLNREINLIKPSLAKLEAKARGTEDSVPAKLEALLEKLISLRRRFSRFKTLIQDQAAFCSKHNRRGWDLGLDDKGDVCQLEPSALEDGSAEDFQQALGLVSDSLVRTEQTISLITGLMSLTHGKLSMKEMERTAAVNRVLMILTFVATFFLPINAVTSIMDLGGDYAPDKPGFGIFLAVALPLAFSLVALLGCVSYRGRKASGVAATTL